jgi:hypothetical protein
MIRPEMRLTKQQQQHYHCYPTNESYTPQKPQILSQKICVTVYTEISMQQYSIGYHNLNQSTNTIIANVWYLNKIQSTNKV